MIDKDFLEQSQLDRVCKIYEWSGKSTVYQIGELLVSKLINFLYIKHHLC